MSKKKKKPSDEKPSEKPGETRLEQVMKERFGGLKFEGLMNSIVDELLNDPKKLDAAVNQTFPPDLDPKKTH